MDPLARSQPSVPLCESVEEFIQWLELDRHASSGTVAGYRNELWRFQRFAHIVDEHGQGDPAVGAGDSDLSTSEQLALFRTRRPTSTCELQEICNLGLLGVPILDGRLVEQDVVPGDIKALGSG